MPEVEGWAGGYTPKVVLDFHSNSLAYFLKREAMISDKKLLQRRARDSATGAPQQDTHMNIHFADALTIQDAIHPS